MCTSIDVNGGVITVHQNKRKFIKHGSHSYVLSKESFELRNEHLKQLHLQSILRNQHE